MWKRLLFDSGALALVLVAPWWVALAYTLLGIILFPWYVEALLLGLFFDTVYGMTLLPWYQRMTHTTLFIIPVGIGQYIKSRIDV